MQTPTTSRAMPFSASGGDLRNFLVDRLFESLNVGGVQDFLNGERLTKGEDVGTSLEKAIRDTVIQVPIFYRNYAGCPWGLREISQMWKSTVSVIFLFHGISLSDVRRHDSGLYADAFQKHSTDDRHGTEAIGEWKKVLKDVRDLSGWFCERTVGYEGNLVKRVLLDIRRTFNQVPLDVVEGVIGLKEFVGNIFNWDGWYCCGCEHMGNGRCGKDNPNKGNV